MGFVDIGIYKKFFYVNGMFKDAVVMQKLLQVIIELHKKTFGKFGKITSIKLEKDETKKGKGMIKTFFK